MEVSSDISQEAPITAKRRDTFDIAITVKDSNGGAYNFTTEVAKMQVRTALASEGGTVLVTLDSPSEIIMTSGSMQLTKDAASMTIDPGDYVYDLQVTLPTGKKKTWLTGAFVVTDDVTD